jgi:hypothetical protein
LRFGGALAMLVRKMERRRLWTADRVPWGSCNVGLILLMGDHGFDFWTRLFLPIAMPSIFWQTLKSFFSCLKNILGLIFNYTFLYINYTFLITCTNTYKCVFGQKNVQKCSSTLAPRLRLGRQAPKNKINRAKPWSPIRLLEAKLTSGDKLTVLVYVGECVCSSRMSEGVKICTPLGSSIHSKVSKFALGWVRTPTYVHTSVNVRDLMSWVLFQ